MNDQEKEIRKNKIMGIVIVATLVTAFIYLSSLKKQRA